MVCTRWLCIPNGSNKLILHHQQDNSSIVIHLNPTLSNGIATNQAYHSHKNTIMIFGSSKRQITHYPHCPEHIPFVLILFILVGQFYVYLDDLIGFEGTNTWNWSQKTC